MIKTSIKSLLIVLGAVVLLSLIGYVVTRREGLVKGEVFIPTPAPAMEAREVAPTGETTPTASVAAVTITPTVVPIVSPTGILSTSSARRLEVIISNSSFQPADITTGKGSLIVWKNNDAVSHTVTADDGSFNSGEIKAGGSFDQRFDYIKTYSYSCSFHPEMKGTIVIK